MPTPITDRELDSLTVLSSAVPGADWIIAADVILSWTGVPVAPMDATVRLSTS
jgi:hypothetical protein